MAVSPQPTLGGASLAALGMAAPGPPRPATEIGAEPNLADATASPAAPPCPEPVSGGVGMGLKACERGLEITEILPGGPVHRTGKVRVGDILKKVDGKTVGDTVAAAKEQLVGPMGSTVTLTVLRHAPFGMPDAISVCVVRGRGSGADRPMLPSEYTPFTGDILGKLDEYKSTIHDFVRKYTEEGRSRSGDSIGVGTMEWWMAGGSAGSGAGARASDRERQTASPHALRARAIRTDSGSAGSEQRHSLVADATTSATGHQSHSSGDSPRLSPGLAANRRVIKAGNDTLRRVLQDADEAKENWHESSDQLVSLQAQLKRAQGDLHAQKQLAAQELDAERARYGMLAQQVESLQSENSTLLEQVRGGRQQASQEEQEGKIAHLEDALRLLRIEQRHGNGRAMVLMSERDDALQRLAEAERALRLSEERELANTRDREREREQERRVARDLAREYQAREAELHEQLHTLQSSQVLQIASMNRTCPPIRGAL